MNETGVHSITDDDGSKWNYINLAPPPLNHAFRKTPVTLRVTRNVSAMRSTLLEAYQCLKKLDCLHAESALLSRALYRNYNRLRRDKGYQFVKMIMRSLNKYLKLDLVGAVETTLSYLPHKIDHLKEVNLPVRSQLTWLLARIQAFASLFLRIYDLCKEGGLYLFQRLRLGWCSAMLVFTLSIVARIRVIARFLILRAVSWHSGICEKIEVLKKISNDPQKDYPKDLKQWLGGLERLMVATTTVPKTRLDMVFDLIDLVSDDEENEIRNIFPKEDDEEIKRLFESVTIPDDDDPTLLISSDEDVGVIVEFDGNKDKSIPSVSKSVGKSTIDSEVVILNSDSSSPECISTVTFKTRGTMKRKLQEDSVFCENPINKKKKGLKKRKNAFKNGKMAVSVKKHKKRNKRESSMRLNPLWIPLGM